MIRGIGLRSAVAINVATMVGAGPLITIPLVVAALHGSLSVWPWIAGAAIALCDGLVYAELASRFPRSGGTYAYLREAFGPHGPGRLAAFVFVWQLLFVAPLTLATGYIGFAQYAAYLWPALGAEWPAHAVALGVGVVTLLSLYRTIPRIARHGARPRRDRRRHVGGGRDLPVSPIRSHPLTALARARALDARDRHRRARRRTGHHALRLRRLQRCGATRRRGDRAGRARSRASIVLVDRDRRRGLRRAEPRRLLGAPARGRRRTRRSSRRWRSNAAPVTPPPSRSRSRS